MSGPSKIPPAKKPGLSKVYTSSQSNLRLAATSQSASSSRNNSPNRSVFAQNPPRASLRPARQAQSVTSTSQDSQSTELPTIPSNDTAESPVAPGPGLLAELKDRPIEETFRELKPKKSETSPTRWAQLYENAKGYNSLMRWYDGANDDSDDDGPTSDEEPLGGDSKGKTPISGQGNAPPAVDDRRNQAGPSDSQAPGGPGPLGQEEEEEDPDAITAAPFLPEVPADEFGKPIDLTKHPHPNAHTKTYDSRKNLPPPKTVQDDPYAYPGSHPHKMRHSGCKHESRDEVVCEETQPQNCRYNQSLEVGGMCESCTAANIPDPTLSRSQKIRRSIRGVGSWIGRTARTIARGARRKPIPENMRQNPAPPEPASSGGQREHVGSSAGAGPSGTQRSYNQRGASGAGSTARRTSQGGDGQSGEGQTFEGRGPAPGTAGLPRPNQPMTPEQQETLRRMRGPTGSSVGAGGADPTLHVDDESDKS
ncbi:hypothetical protein TWF225_003397 [Orbilia oligospora]|nr:hypothetical protein TWF225_003397 [Orbilia oligospora]KAF3250037.1 hypothetical protein TWF128_007621 [Orbilia oligospora]KAF3289045.1 hypothetical protein TWF132_007711 [Orbilia oligospora]